MERVRKLKDNLKSIRGHSFFRDPAMLAFEFFSFFLLVILFFIIFLGIKPGGVLIQLRFNSFAGVTDVGLWYKVYNLVVVGTIIYAVNSALAYFFYDKERLASFFLLVAASMVEIILIIEAANIVKLVNL